MLLETETTHTMIQVSTPPDGDMKETEKTPDQVDDNETPIQWLRRITLLLSQHGVETHGIAPVPVEGRVNKRWYQMFFVWFSANMNILAFSVGTVGPAFFSLGVRDAITTIVVVDIVSCLIPAYFAVFGPKLGMRAMVQSRFSWGFYGAMIPSILNAISCQGFSIVNCIVGGQTVASVSSHLDDTLGIVIIAVICLVVTFFGCRFLHWYESFSWIPSVVTFIAMLAVGYPQLHANQYTLVPPPTAAAILSFSTTVAASIVSWGSVAADYGVYHSPAASSTWIFTYIYGGLLVSNIIPHVLGIVFAAAAPSVPAWNAGFQDSTSVGGLIYGVLTPLGGFSKFLTVFVALTTIPSATVLMMYSMSTSFMAIASWFLLVPRWVYIIVSEGILVPVAVIGAKKFYTTFVTVINIIGYWTAAFAGIILVEHILFRRGSFTEEAYPIMIWNSPDRLPSSAPAVIAFFCASGALIPFMSQAWYVGPVALAGSGDCALIVGFVVGAFCYAGLRGLEKGWRNRSGVKERGSAFEEELKV